MGPESNSKLKEWLDNLQQESWQLELLVSGFAIFLLIGIYAPLADLGIYLDSASQADFRFGIAMIPYFIVQGAWFTLLVNLIIHVILRGLWISTVGLRSVSGDIDFEKLNFSPKFDQFLRKRSGNFDRYIVKLEEICSIIFAFTFLLVFSILAFGFFILCALVIIAPLVLFFQKQGWDGIANTFSQIANLFLIIASLLYFIDFLTLGWMKRRRKFAHFYFPIYRVMSIITLAFLYRPLYYNLIDNKIGRRAGLLVVPYIILAMMAGSTYLELDTYFPARKNSATLLSLRYDENWQEGNYDQLASLPSKYVDNGFIEFFIPYRARRDDKAIQQVCPDLKAGRNTGIIIEGVINIRPLHKSGTKPDSLLQCMGQIHRIYIDNQIYSDPGFTFYEHPLRMQRGLLAILDVDSLSRGKHEIKLESLKTNWAKGRDSLDWQTNALVPFWKE